MKKKSNTKICNKVELKKLNIKTQSSQMKNKLKLNRNDLLLDISVKLSNLITKIMSSGTTVKAQAACEGEMNRFHLGCLLYVSLGAVSLLVKGETHPLGI
jgi:hypothetical protein